MIQKGKLVFLNHPVTCSKISPKIFYVVVNKFKEFGLRRFQIQKRSHHRRVFSVFAGSGFADSFRFRVPSHNPEPLQKLDLKPFRNPEPFLHRF